MFNGILLKLVKPMIRENMSYALITGVSSGIGYELARFFAKDGHNLILVARREERLNQLAGELEIKYRIKTHVISKDLSQPEPVQEIYNWVKENNLRIDYLVNNAGFAVYGSFHDTHWDDEQKMMRLHMEAMTFMIKLFLPDMLVNGYGRILNVGSTGSFVPGPYISIYCATKAYILSLSHALAEELHGSGVTVTVLCPGGTKTEFESNAIRKDTGRNTGAGRPWGMKAERVAHLAYRGLMKGRRLVIPGFHNRMQVFAIRFIPRVVVSRLTKIVMSAHK